MNITADFKAAFRQHALVYQKSLVFFFYWHVYFAVFQIDTTCVLFFAKNIVIFFNTNLYQTVVLQVEDNKTRHRGFCRWNFGLYLLSDDFRRSRDQKKMQEGCSEMCIQSHCLTNSCLTNSCLTNSCLTNSCLTNSCLTNICLLEDATDKFGRNAP